MKEQYSFHKEFVFNLVANAESFKCLPTYERNWFPLTANKINGDSIQVIVGSLVPSRGNQDFLFQLSARSYLVFVCCFLQIETVTCYDKKEASYLYTAEEKGRA